MKPRQKLKIIIAGGKSAGPVIPLFAVAAKIREQKPHVQILVLDVKGSVGERTAEKNHAQFQPIYAGKLRRYWSLRNLFSPILVAAGFIQSLLIMRRFRPDLVLGAGGFVQVSVAWAAWLLGVPVLIHQQDLLPSLANTLVAPIAKRITITFKDSEKDFTSGSGLFRHRPKHKRIVWTGNPFRENLKAGDKAAARKHFGLKTRLPVLLVMGGGTGAEGINQLIYESLPQLAKSVEIIHSTGLGKNGQEPSEHYHPREFIDRMDLAYAASDLVISRAGISALTELVNLKKVSIIIPMPYSHQEYNAEMLFSAGAAVVLDQEITDSQKLTSVVRRLLLDGPTQTLLKNTIATLMPKNADEKIAKLAIELIESHG